MVDTGSLLQRVERQGGEFVGGVQVWEEVPMTATDPMCRLVVLWVGMHLWNRGSGDIVLAGQYSKVEQVSKYQLYPPGISLVLVPRAVCQGELL